MTQQEQRRLQPSEQGPVAVCARGLTLRHGDHVAVDGATLDLPAGRLTAIIGPNGSGKSTLLRAISGLHPVAAGTLEVLGAAPGRQRPRVAHVLQTTRANDAMPITVTEVVRMGRYARHGAFGWLRGPDRDAVAQAMQRMDVSDLGPRHLSELSGGQRQRVHVAQGLSQQADLLLLDEPVTGLDFVSLERIDAVLRDEQRAGRTVVVTTHDVETASQADHVVLLATRVVACGSPEEVLTSEHLMEAYGGHLHELPSGALVLDDPAPHQHGHGHGHSHGHGVDNPPRSG